MRGIAGLLVTIGVAVLSLIVILGLSLGIGWVLTLILPLSLFEGGLLSLLAGAFIVALWRDVMRAARPSWPEDEEEEDEDGWEDDWDLDEIPESRFWAQSAERTWENWFRYVLANAVYEDLQANEEVEGGKQGQELAIRLAEVALGVLKKRAPRTRNWQVSSEELKRALGDAGQRAYDDELLATTAVAVNVELVYLLSHLRKVNREGSWNKPAEIF